MEARSQLRHRPTIEGQKSETRLTGLREVLNHLLQYHFRPHPWDSQR
jgi:hypothetical protein